MQATARADDGTRGWADGTLMIRFEARDGMILSEAVNPLLANSNVAAAAHNCSSPRQ